MNNKPWRFPEVTDWTKSNIKTLDLMHTKAQQSYEYSVDVADRITSRAFTFISMLIPIISLLIGIVGKEINENSVNTFITIILLATALFLTLILWMLIDLVRPRKFMGNGREPREICNPEMIQDDRFTEEQQFISLLRDELTALQHKITTNKEQNNKRIKKLKYLIVAITGLSLFVISSLIIYFTTAML